jgi:hypothetical protein
MSSLVKSRRVRGISNRNATTLPNVAQVQERAVQKNPTNLYNIVY